MASAMAAAGASSSFTRQLHLKKDSTCCVIPQFQKTSFLGLSIPVARRASLNSSVAADTASLRKKVFEITARKSAPSKTIEVEVDKPLGLTLGQKEGGGIVIAAVQNGGNAAKAGLKAGDQVLYTSSFFGDELWPADKLSYTKTAIQAKPNSVYFVVSRGAEVDVKRLQKRPAPPTFGRKLTETQKERATHICLDCGYIYTQQKSFEDLGDDYACPQCRAPKKRFARYDVNTGRAAGGGLPPIGVIIGLVAGIGGVGALLVYGLQ